MTKSEKSPDSDDQPTIREVIIARPDQAALTAAVRAFLLVRLRQAAKRQDERDAD